MIDWQIERPIPIARNLIAEYLWNSIVELRLRLYLMLLKIDPHDRQNRQDKLIEIDERGSSPAHRF